MSLFSILSLLLLLLLFQPAPTSAQFCLFKCHEKEVKALRDCQRSPRILIHCTVRTCMRHKGRIGYTCTNRPPPLLNATAALHDCPATCVTDLELAEMQCSVSRRPRPGCYLRRCTTLSQWGREYAGYMCAANLTIPTITASPSPSLNPSTSPVPIPPSTISNMPNSPSPSPPTPLAPGAAVELSGRRIGESLSFDVTFHGGAGGAPREDLYILVETGDSMSKALTALQTRLPDLVAMRKAASENVAFGMGVIRDESDPSGGFSNVQTITADVEEFKNSVADLKTSGGGMDIVPEGNLAALYRVATCDSVGWRPGARRIVLYLGNAPGHEPTCVDGKELGRTEVICALRKSGITVVALSFEGGLDRATTAFTCAGQAPMRAGQAPMRAGQGSAIAGQGSAIAGETDGALAMCSEDTIGSSLNCAFARVIVPFTANVSECSGRVSSTYNPPFPFTLKTGEAKTVVQTIHVEKGACEEIGPFECRIRYSAGGAWLPDTIVKVSNVVGCDEVVGCTKANMRRV